MANIIYYCKAAIKNMKINSPDDLNSIGNMDETPVFFEMYQNKTIAKIGDKKVNVKTFGCEKMRISIILKILANGDKIPPLIVLKVNQGKLWKQDYQNIFIVLMEKYLLKLKIILG